MDTSDSEIYAPRAESPELTSTPPPYLRQVVDAAPSGQINVDGPDPEAHLDAALVVSIPLPVSFSKPEDHPGNLGDHDMALSGGVLLEAMPLSSPKTVPPPPHVAPLPSTHSNLSLREFAGSDFLMSTPDDSFDPISTDAENPRSESWLSSFERLKTKTKRPPPSPQVVSNQPKDTAGVAEEFIHSRSAGQETENPISQGSAASAKRNSKEQQYLPQADFVQFVELVTVNEDNSKPIPLEKKSELQVPSKPGGTIIQETPQPSPAEPVIMNESAVNSIPSETKAERHDPSESGASITKGLPQPLPEEPVNVNKATLKPTAPGKKEEPHIPSEPGENITKEPPRLSPEGGPSHPRNPVNMIEETAMLKPSGKEMETGAPSAGTSSTKAKRKQFQPLPQTDPPQSPKVASSAEVAVKSKPSDVKLGSMLPLGFIGSTEVKISQLQSSSQASSASTEESISVAESTVQPTASKEMQDAAFAESSKDKEIKLKANGTKRTTRKPNGAAAGEKIFLDRKAEKSVHKSANTPKLAKDGEPKLKAVIQPEEKVKEARISYTRPETNTLHENVGGKEDELINLTAISLPQSSLRRSKRSQPTRKRNGPGPDPPGDLSADSVAPSAKRKEPNLTQKSSKLAAPNVRMEQSPQTKSRWVAVSSAAKSDKAFAGAVDTRVLSEPSSPRGPAQYMSRPHSGGSFSSVSSSGSDSDSQDDMVLLRQAVTLAKTKSEQGIKSLGHHASNSRALANTKGSIGKGPVSKTGQSPISISSSDHNSSEGTGSVSHAEEVESHLSLKPPRDLVPSIPIADSPHRGRPRGRKPTSSAPVSRPLDYSVKSGSILNKKSTPVPRSANPQGERPSSSAPGASRPINSRYPSMADLIKKPRPTEQSRPDKISPSKSAANAGATGAFPFYSFSGSSSSETSSSEDEH